MTAYPPSVSSTPALTDEATLTAALDWVSTQIPLETQGSYSPQTFYQVLLWAASRQDTVEHACQVLTGMPSRRVKKSGGKLKWIRLVAQAIA